MRVLGFEILHQLRDRNLPERRVVISCPGRKMGPDCSQSKNSDLQTEGSYFLLFRTSHLLSEIKEELCISFQLIWRKNPLLVGSRNMLSLFLVCFYPLPRFSFPVPPFRNPFALPTPSSAVPFLHFLFSLRERDCRE